MSNDATRLRRDSGSLHQSAGERDGQDVYAQSHLRAETGTVMPARNSRNWPLRLCLAVGVLAGTVTLDRVCRGFGVPEGIRGFIFHVVNGTGWGFVIADWNSWHWKTKSMSDEQFCRASVCYTAHIPKEAVIKLRYVIARTFGIPRRKLRPELVFNQIPLVKAPLGDVEGLAQELEKRGYDVSTFMTGQETVGELVARFYQAFHHTDPVKVGRKPFQF